MSPTVDAYGGAQRVLGEAPPKGDISGVLPFTGLDIGLMVFGVVFLLAVGLALRFAGRAAD